MNKVHLTINDKQLEAEQGATIMEVALENDIYIAHLCYNPNLVPGGVCRFMQSCEN